MISFSTPAKKYINIQLFASNMKQEKNIMFSLIKLLDYCYNNYYIEENLRPNSTRSIKEDQPVMSPSTASF